MIAEPVINNPSEPLISILIFNYSRQCLKKCLDSIFNQNILTNIELVLIDDATRDGSWEIALEYQKQFPAIITIQRNREVLGPLDNLGKCMQISYGQYFVVLTGDRAFMPEYIKKAVKAMIEDEFTENSLVLRADDAKHSLPGTRILAPIASEKPLVSVLCYNYNYGRYLRQCLESIFSQTYENIELCFSDNASTDESWEIALEFLSKYPDRISIIRNRKNFGPDANFANCKRNMSGKYFINFCSDDVLEPEYVENCISVLEKYENVGMVIVNRAIIDENGKRTDEMPFYNQTCIIPGEEQAAVYLMAGINPSVSQVMYRRKIADKRAATGGLAARYYGTRILDYNIAMDFDIGYIRETLMQHRIHSKSDTSQADSNLMPIMGLYVLNHQLADMAGVRNLSGVTERLPKSLEKLGGLSIRYCIRSLLAGNESIALRYFHLAAAVEPKITDDSVWKRLELYWESDLETKSRILSEFRDMSNLAARDVSYDPPKGSIFIS